MTWQLIALLHVVASGVVAPLVFAHLGENGPCERSRRVMHMYAWCAGFALVGLLFADSLTFSPDVWQIAIVGLLMPAGVFFQWRAIAWSPSRSAVFKGFVSVIALILSAVVLGEWMVLADNALLIVGFILAALSVVLFVRRDAALQREKEKMSSVPLAFYANAGAATMIFGLAVFLENYWAKTGVPPAEFLAGWYVAAFVGSVLLFLATRGNNESAARRQPHQHLVLLAAAAVFASLALAFASFRLVEQTVVLPIYAIGDIVGYVLIGVVALREWKRIKGIGWAYLAGGIAGAIMIALAR